jgi:hypothetical protein
MLPALDSVKDLGVIVDPCLNFSKHIDGAVSKANQRVYLLLKSFKNRNISLMVFAFKVYILPLLEYCSPIWSPCKLHDIDRIERVQRSFTKKLEGLHDLPYAERLIACNLPSLELRRLWADLMLCFKIIHKQISLSFEEFFEFDCNTHHTRGHRLKLKIPFVKNKVRKSFFANRIIPVWNALPHDVVNVTCGAIFKHKLKTLDLNKFLLREVDF